MPPLFNAKDLQLESASKHHKKKNIYSQILDSCLRRIRTRHVAGETQCFYQLPLFVFGLPVYDCNKAQRYIIKALKSLGFVAHKLPDRHVYVSWASSEQLEEQTYSAPPPQNLLISTVPTLQQQQQANMHVYTRTEAEIPNDFAVENSYTQAFPWISATQPQRYDLYQQHQTNQHLLRKQQNYAEAQQHAENQRLQEQQQVQEQKQQSGWGGAAEHAHGLGGDVFRFEPRNASYGLVQATPDMLPPDMTPPDMLPPPSSCYVPSAIPPYVPQPPPQQVSTQPQSHATSCPRKKKAARKSQPRPPQLPLNDNRRPLSERLKMMNKVLSENK